jgi:CRP/FNR family transcriptional regulator, nitrogen oxide reductase regulator
MPVALHNAHSSQTIEREAAPPPDCAIDHPFIQALPASVRRAVVDRAIHRRYPRGEAVYWQGDQVQYLPLLVSGHAKTVANTEAGREILTQVLGPGATPGWPEFLAGDRARESLVALGSLELWLLPLTPVRLIIGSSRGAAGAYASLLEDHRLNLLQQLAATRAPLVPARLAGLLLHLLATLGDRQSGEIPIRLTRQDLADAAGTTVETTIRVMRKWQGAGTVETLKDRLVVLDPDALTAASAS